MNKQVLRLFCEFPSIANRLWPLLPPNYRKDHIKRALLRLVHKGDICIEVGANVGQHTPFLSHLTGPSGRVIAFEPVESSRAILRDRVMSYSNVDIEPLALGSEDGEVELFQPGDASSMASLRPHHEAVTWEPFNSVSVIKGRSTSLDSYLTRNPVKRLDFLKVDIEGAEMLFLNGARDTLRKFKPTLLMEVDGCLTEAFGVKPREIFDFISGIGYSRSYRLASTDDYVFSNP